MCVDVLDIIQLLVVPSNLITILLLAGLALLAFRRSRRAAILPITAGALLYIAFGVGPVSYWLLGKLEHRHPALISLENLKEVDTIVVLSGHAETLPYIPISSRVSSSTAFRLTECLRLWRRLPQTRILIPGVKGVPLIMKKCLISLGLPGDAISIEEQSSNTYENAINIQKRLGGRSFILVTSAGHMPRAMAIFQKLGMNPIPAPTDYQTGKNPMAAKFLPTPQHLYYSDLAVHEFLGIFWYRLKGRM